MRDDINPLYYFSESKFICFSISYYSFENAIKIDKGKYKICIS